MATKREITEELRRQYGNVLSQNEVREYLRKGSNETAAWLADVPFMREGRKKSFLAIDIARKISDSLQTTA